MAQRQHSLLTASAVMVAVTLVLFFLPLVNGLIGGAVGGWMAGTAARGLKAAILPAIVVGLALWALLALFDIPVGFGFIAGLGGMMLVLIADLGILLGGALGGAAAERTAGRHTTV